MKTWIFLILFLMVFPGNSSGENSSLIFLNRILSANEPEFGKNLQRISGGRYLLPDNPADYALYELLEKNIREFRMDIENESDLVSYYSYQETSAGDIIDILQKIRELILQRSDPVYSENDKGMIEREIGQDYDQIIFVLKESEFNGKKIFGELFESQAVKSLFLSPDHTRLLNVDNLIDYFIFRRTYAGSRIDGLKRQISGDKIARENMTKSRAAGDTDIAGEISEAGLDNLKLTVNILMLNKNLAKEQ